MELKRASWTDKDYAELVEYLKSLADEKYKSFSDSLTPGQEKSYGVRIPLIRSAAKEIVKGNYAEFLKCEKGGFREEIMLEGIVMSLIKCPYDEMLVYMKDYSGKINSWDTCDTVSFNGIKRYLPEFWRDAEYFIYNENPWKQRFGFLCLMKFYLTDEYIDGVLNYVGSVDSDFYYVCMMQAWLIATAAAKQRDKTLEYLERGGLNDFTHNKAIQKIRESYSVSPEDKEYVLTLKR